MRGQTVPHTGPEDTLYIMLRPVRIFPHPSEEEISRYLFRHQLHTDSIVKKGHAYYLYVSSVATGIDSMVLSVPGKFPANLKKYIRRQAPANLARIHQNLDKISGLRLEGWSLWHQDTTRILMLKGAYRPPPGKLFFSLTPVFREKWQWQGQGQLQIHNLLSAAETLALDFRISEGTSILRYKHIFPYLWGTAWVHRYQLYFFRRPDTSFAILHRIEWGYQRQNLYAGTGIWQRTDRHTYDKTTVTYYLGRLQAATRRLESNLTGGWGKDRQFFLSLETSLKTPAEKYGEHHALFFRSSDSTLLASERQRRPAEALLLGKFEPEPGNIIFEESLYDLTKNHIKWYVFHRFYAEFHKHSGYRHILLAGTGWQFERDNTLWNLSVFYPYLFSYHSDYKPVMITLKWQMHFQ